MTANQARLMFIPLMATFIMASFVTTMGLLTEPAAGHFGVSIADIAAQFSWFTGGVFIGGLFAFFVFDYLPIKTVTIASYMLAIVLIVLLHFSTSYFLLSVYFGLIGALFAIVGCGGVTIITQQWTGKRSQMIMVAQDALFNGGGILFSAIATWFIVNQSGWSSMYLFVTLLLGIVVVLAATSSFKPVVRIDEEAGAVGEWNAGIILVGVSLLIFMLAKISIFVWAPQFIQQTFNAGPEEGGRFMENLFIAAFVGSLFGTWAASKIEVRYLLYGFVVVSLMSVFSMTTATSMGAMMIVGYCYGVSVSATYNSYVAFGLSFIGQPSHKNVVYLQFMSGLGSTAAPVVSSMIVKQTDSILASIQFCFAALVVVGVTLFVSEILYRKSNIK